jgi:carboxypeptidase C (cathepsin A)
MDAEADPSIYGVNSAFHTAIQTQLVELGVTMERPYRLNKLIDKVWSWLLEEKAPNGAGYINVVPYLGRAMRRNEHLRVLVTLGYYDLATPFFGAENALSQDGLVHERISYGYYEVGHMIFLHEPSRVRFLHDVRQFILDGAAPEAANG